jgi:UDP-N-acetylglucosamine--N-acetylmuramyl-(pentapeptide) pyrophosphoryl-undecaprenol N-acetylglucosamine transferase
VAAAVPELTGRLGLDVWHQTGERDLRGLESLGSSGGRYHPFAFADDLPEKVYAADLVVSRAGAGSISEVSAAGIPMVLIPGPFAGGHQRLNAQPFERAGAARVIADEECDGPRLTREITAIADDPAVYSKMVIAMRGLGRPQAAEEVAGLLQAAVSS